MWEQSASLGLGICKPSSPTLLQNSKTPRPPSLSHPSCPHLPAHLCKLSRPSHHTQYPLATLFGHQISRIRICQAHTRTVSPARQITSCAFYI